MLLTGCEAIRTEMEAANKGWRRISSSPRLTAFVEEESVVRHGSYVNVWVRVEFAQLEDGPPQHNKATLYLQADCDTGVLRVLRGNYYLLGKFVGEVPPEETAETRPVTPGTTGGSVHKFACGKK
jgi:hypothetical protein